MNIFLILYVKYYFVVLDIISISNNTSESTKTFEIRKDKFFKGSIYDIKYSHSNGKNFNFNYLINVNLKLN